MNFLQVLAHLLFGAPRRQPPPKRTKTAPPPKQVRPEPRPEPAPRPMAAPEPLAPAPAAIEKTVVAAAAAVEALPKVSVKPVGRSGHRGDVQPPENKGVAFLSQAAVAEKYLGVKDWDGCVPAHKTIGPFQWRNAMNPEDMARIRANPAAKHADPRNIVLLTDWQHRAIVDVDIPQLALIPNERRHTIQFHRDGADQLQALWRDWERANLLEGVILTFDGGYNPRYKGWKDCQHGAEIADEDKKLSNHSFGTAFDINASDNPNEPIPFIPRLRGERGCVRDLVALANEHGFYWGGDFHSRPDGMHFELGRPIV